MPALEKPIDDGKPAQNGDASAATSNRASAASSAVMPDRPRRSRVGMPSATTVRKPPQPISAAAWLRKVAEGGRLKASAAGADIATAAQAGHHRRCAVIRAVGE